ncbi:hypothetical protein AAG570_005753 [Ranatra chinensis]|uniref:Secreted protein n=1 Tax=Ranatra chinensis TaxID=642074 RepID=A0ABD0XYP3_9HEMI
MATRLLLLSVLCFCLLQGGKSFDVGNGAVDKIEETIRLLLTPLTESRTRLEEGLKKQMEQHTASIERQKAIYRRILQTLPDNCAPEAASMVSKFEAMDLDSCENLTYTIEEARRLVIQGYNYSGELVHDLGNITHLVVQCPNKNPILFARCVIEVLIVVRDKIGEYKPVVLPYEEKVKDNLLKMAREFGDCLNFKTANANKVMRAAVAKCPLGKPR